jgi:hypothetical protein
LPFAFGFAFALALPSRGANQVDQTVNAALPPLITFWASSHGVRGGAPGYEKHEGDDFLKLLFAIKQLALSLALLGVLVSLSSACFGSVSGCMLMTKRRTRTERNE